jgi:transposase, IS6 family
MREVPHPRPVGLSQISGVDGRSGMAVNFVTSDSEGPMILSAIAEKLKRRSKDDFKGRHFQASLIPQAVSWYMRYPLSYRAIDKQGTPVGFLLTATRDLEAAKHFFREMLKDQPLRAPELEKRAAWYRNQISFSWRVDETYVRAKGRWKYLYWAINKGGATLDFYFARPAQREGGQALSRGGAEALTRLAPAGHNTDKNSAHGEAIAGLKNAGAIPEELEHRQAKYLNNRLEGNYGKLKRLIHPTLGFQSMRTARATIKGFEVMRMFTKGQFRFWIDAVSTKTEVSFINRLFGLYV